MPADRQRDPAWAAAVHGDALLQDVRGSWQRLPAGMDSGMRQALGLPVLLNCASAEVLAQIEGVSRRAADSIVAYRATTGPIDAWPVLLRVRHVGAKTQQALHKAALLDKRCPMLLAQAGPLIAADAQVAVQTKEQSVQRRWLVDIVAHLPQGAISRLWGVITRWRRPQFLVRALQNTFIKAVGIDMSESEHPVEAYGSLEDLFVRRLKEGLRPIDADPEHVVSPVDARVGAQGIVEQGTLLQIKGRQYDLARLLQDPERAKSFEGGAYVTFYLAPRDYHNIHAPAAGHVVAARLVPGMLMPVFEESLQKVDELFARNERIITYLRSPDAGEMAVVKVGATLVGRIATTYDASLRGNVRGAGMRQVRYDKPMWFDKGEALGSFELGSTVVLIAQRGKLAFDPLAWGSFVKVGQRIGTLVGPQRGRDAGGAPSIVWQPNEP